MVDEYIPIEFEIDEAVDTEFGETFPIPTRANYNQTDPNADDYILGRENIATKDDLASTIFFTENQLPLDTPTDVTELVTYKPAWEEAIGDFGYSGEADTIPHMRVVWKEGLASSTNEEMLPLVKATGTWADSARFTLYFGNKNYTLKLVYQYDINNYTDLLSVTALLTKESTIGDIDTALDNIIAIQESLIGGDSV